MTSALAQNPETAWLESPHRHRNIEPRLKCLLLTVYSHFCIRDTNLSGTGGSASTIHIPCWSTGIMPLAPDEEMSESHQFCRSFLVSGSFGGGSSSPPPAREIFDSWLAGGITPRPGGLLSLGWFAPARTFGADKTST